MDIQQIQEVMEQQQQDLTKNHLEEPEVQQVELEDVMQTMEVMEQLVDVNLMIAHYIQKDMVAAEAEDTHITEETVEDFVCQEE